MLIQLEPMLPVMTPKGKGFAFVLIDYGQEFDTLFKTIISATGEVWDIPQSQIRGVVNISMGRISPSLPAVPDGAIPNNPRD